MPTVRGKSATRNATRNANEAGKAAGKKGGTARLQSIEASVFEQIPWLVHGFSTRSGGDSRVYGGSALNLGITQQDTKQAVEHNREAFQKKLGAPGWPLVHMHQVHSDVIHNIISVDSRGVETALGVVTGDGLAERGTGHSPVPTQAEIGRQRITGQDGKPLLVGDGLITEIPGLLLAVKTADCMPIIIVDPKKRAVGVFHAGWRGTLKRIAEKGVGEMRRWFGSRPQDLKAALGPSIRNCCYNVGEEVRDHFRSQFEYADTLFREWQTYEDIHLKYPLLFLTQRAPGHSELPYRIFLDLAEANRRQLLDAGLRERNIEVIEGCTSCDTKRFFSHRKEKGVTGRMMAVVGIRTIAD